MSLICTSRAMSWDLYEKIIHYVSISLNCKSITTAHWSYDIDYGTNNHQ